jgi:hypothetical protein
VRRLSLAALLALSCSNGSSRLYDNNDLQLATAYTAKELCSCVFVMEMSEDYCRNWTRASPAVAKFTVDYERKTVESTALLEWGTRAKLDSAKFGCVLDD